MHPNPAAPRRAALWHRLAARALLRDDRPVFGVDEHAPFDETRFVIEDSYRGGSDALKKTFNEAQPHREAVFNAWAEEELDYRRGDDVVQVGRIDMAAARPVSSHAGAALTRRRRGAHRRYRRGRAALPAACPLVRHGPRLRGPSVPMTTIADSFVSLAAFAGILLLLVVLRRRDRSGAVRSPTTWRFLLALGIVAALLLARVLDWTTSLPLFGRLSTLAAGLVPLGALLVMEGLMRRHAPLALKVVVALGSLVFVVAAFAPPSWRDATAFDETWALFAYQFAVFALVALTVLWRDRAALSAAENAALDRIALSLALILPVLVTDYRGIVDLPVRLGGVAILFLVWLAVTLGSARSASAPFGFAIHLASALLAAFALAAMFGLGLAGFVQAAAVMLSATMVAVVAADALAPRRRAEPADLVEMLARADTRDVERFLASLARHPAVADARILRADDLLALDVEALHPLFDAMPVQRRGAVANEQLDWLLKREGATHVFRVRRDPVMLVALALAGIATSEEQEAELALVQRMAEAVAR